jgi:hypothetical protein
MKRAFVGLILTAVALGVLPPVRLTASDPAVVGLWSAVISWPAVAVHAHLLKTGKVLTWQYGSTAAVWNPADFLFASAANPFSDVLCSGHVFLPDGRIIVLGGWQRRTHGLGVTDVGVFDPDTEAWTQAAPMAYQRWYPTATQLPDGRVLVVSGDQNQANDIAAIPEIYDPGTNRWTQIAPAANPIPVYPFMFVLPDGRVLQVGSSEVATSTQALDLSTQTWSVVDGNIVDGASAVMYAPGKILKAGTAADSGNSGSAAATAYVIDATQPSPAWQQTASMAFPRSFMNLTALPDGNVLVTGGGTDRSSFNTGNAILPAELWSPSTQTFTTMASMKTPRLYHSVALLLPDGRVLVSGGGSDEGVADQLTTEIYLPPYLFKGARPSIAAAPSSVNYGSSFFVNTPDAATIASVSLLAPGSVTHFFNQTQHFVPLSFVASPGGLTISAPPNANVAPTGYYMLFLVNRNGVPSIGAFVNVAQPASSVVPNVVNLRQTAATSAITAAGLVVGHVTMGISTTVPVDSIISQSPPAGTTVTPSSSVDLVVAQAVAPTLTYPVKGAVSADLSQPITWTSVANAQAYYLYVGTTPGAKDLVNTGEIQVTSYLAAGVPSGQTLYARIWARVSGVWRYSDSTFSAAPVTATITAPAAGAVNADLTQPIQWAAVPYAQAYYLYVGTTVGAKDLVDTGETLQTAYLAKRLPAGQTVYARLWTKVGGVWRHVDSTFSAAPVTATITAPAAGAVNADLTQPIQWTSVPNAQAYTLWVGTSVGASNVVNTFETQQTSYQPASLPANVTLYARMWTKVGGVWRYVDSTFSAASPTATLTSPANGASNVSPLQLIQWTSVPNVQAYTLWVGTSVGANDVMNTFETQQTSYQPASLPANVTLYARMWTKVGGVWRYIDSTFSAAP